MTDLFALDPGDFVAARDQLARELRKQGQNDKAKATAALRRPSVPAWALNQVARTDRSEIAELLDAAASAQQAQAAALSGRDREGLRAALDRRRSAVRAVVRVARAVVDASGRSGDTYERDIEVAVTAVLDAPELIELLRAGRLTDVKASTDGDDDNVVAMFAASIESAPETPEVDEKAAARARRTATADVTRAEKKLAAAEEKVRVTEARAHAAAAAVDDARQARAAVEAEVEAARAALAELEG